MQTTSSEQGLALCSTQRPDCVLADHRLPDLDGLEVLARFAGLDGFIPVPVVRHAIIASSFALRFQGAGYFLTDARMHRGTSGSPVVMPAAETERLPGDPQWKRLGAHSARLDVGTRDRPLNEALRPNCAWHADILLTLTET